MTTQHLLNYQGLPTPYTHPSNSIAAGFVSAENLMRTGVSFLGVGGDKHGDYFLTYRQDPLLRQEYGDNAFRGPRYITGTSGHGRTDFCDLSPPGTCGGPSKSIVDEFSDVPPKPGVKSSIRRVGDVTVVTYYPGSDAYDQKFGKTKSESTSTSTPTSSCAKGSCSRPSAPLPRPAPVLAPAPTPAPAPIAPIRRTSHRFSDRKIVSVILYGDDAERDELYRALGQDVNFFGNHWDYPEMNLLNYKVDEIKDANVLEKHLQKEVPYNVIISCGQKSNDVLEICERTNYDGSLILLGGATSGVIRSDLQIPSTVKSAVITHGQRSRSLLMSADDIKDLVNNVPTFVYVNESDNENSQSLTSLVRINRVKPNSYLKELVRELKLSQLEKDFAAILAYNFGFDRYVKLGPWF